MTAQPVDIPKAIPSGAAQPSRGSPSGSFFGFDDPAAVAAANTSSSSAAESPTSVTRAHFRSEDVMAFEGRRNSRLVWICDREPTSASTSAAVNVPSASTSQPSPSPLTADAESPGRPLVPVAVGAGASNSETTSPGDSPVSTFTPLCHLGERPAFVHSDTLPDVTEGDKEYRRSLSRKNSLTAAGSNIERLRKLSNA